MTDIVLYDKDNDEIKATVTEGQAISKYVRQTPTIYMHWGTEYDRILITDGVTRSEQTKTSSETGNLIIMMNCLYRCTFHCAGLPVHPVPDDYARYNHEFFSIIDKAHADGNCQWEYKPGMLLIARNRGFPVIDSAAKMIYDNWLMIHSVAKMNPPEQKKKQVPDRRFPIGHLVRVRVKLFYEGYMMVLNYNYWFNSNTTGYTTDNRVDDASLHISVYTSEFGTEITVHWPHARADMPAWYEKTSSHVKVNPVSLVDILELHPIPEIETDWVLLINRKVYTLPEPDRLD